MVGHGAALLPHVEEGGAGETGDERGVWRVNIGRGTAAPPLADLKST